MTPVAPGVVCLTLSGFVNVVFLGEPGGRWWLVDTGLPRHFEAIRAAAAARFGKESKPEAIVLTHGHPDHAGAARALAAYWRVPVRLSATEAPFVTGKTPYPPLDPSTGGPLALLSRFAPSDSIDLGEWAQPLERAPDGWEIVPLPGHTFGQIGLWRASDRVLIAGDALATLDMESWKGLLTRKLRLGIPPGPSTLDWVAVRRSLRAVAALAPDALICGHGRPLCAADTAALLADFAENVPLARKGRFVAEPVRLADDGRLEVPAPIPDRARSVARLAVAAGVLGIGLYLWRRKRGG